MLRNISLLIGGLFLSTVSTGLVSHAGTIDLTALDATANPCDDFYQYACGGWIAKTEIPGDKARWVRSFNVMDEENQALVRSFFENSSKDAASASAEDSKVKMFYQACLDEAAAENVSPGALRKLLLPIESMTSKRALGALLARLHAQSVGAFFSIGAGQDYTDATQVIGQLDQGGLSLPDREYYLSGEPKLKKIREGLVPAMQKMLRLAGLSETEAGWDARVAFALETEIAKISMSQVDRRDPYKTNHKLAYAAVKALSPEFGWDSYFKEAGRSDLKNLNVSAPQYFKALGKLLQKTPLAEIRAYLRWSTVLAYAPAMGKKLVEEDFSFFTKTISGQAQMEPRWKRCVSSANGALGEIVGKMFVERKFGGDSKARTKEMIQRVEDAFGETAKNLSWLDEPTRQKVFAKLAKINNKVGYPDKWKDFTSLHVSPGTYFENTVEASRFWFQDSMSQMDKPVDRAKWGMNPQTVNAYYDPSMNEIVFPAAILQPPFYGNGAGLAEDYGAIGMVMGHELTHGFDDQGSQYDADGNLKNWWPDDVSKRFTERGKCIAKQYGAYKISDGTPVNGDLTEGENIADNGGIKLAYMAWKKAEEAAKADSSVIAGLTPEQRYFLSFAQAWCAKAKPADELRRIKVDPHSPPRFRVNGPVSNFPAFAEAFGCKAGSPMAPADRCELW